jgi:hypothetical protein
VEVLGNNSGIPSLLTSENHMQKMRENNRAGKGSILVVLTQWMEEVYN